MSLPFRVANSGWKIPGEGGTWGRWDLGRGGTSVGVLCHPPKQPFCLHLAPNGGWQLYYHLGQVNLGEQKWGKVYCLTGVLPDPSLILHHTGSSWHYAMLSDMTGTQQSLNSICTIKKQDIFYILGECRMVELVSR